MKGVIWSCDRAGDGIEKLKYIRDRYILSGVNPTREVYSKSSSWIDFDNGDNWRVASAHENSRAIRTNIAWIDARVSNEFFHTVILPALSCYIGPHYYEFFYAKE